MQLLRFLMQVRNVHLCADFSYSCFTKIRQKRRHIKFEKQQRYEIAKIKNNKRIITHSHVDRIYMHYKYEITFQIYTLSCIEIYIK